MGVPKKTGKPGKNGTGKGKGGKVVKGGSQASKGGKIVKAGKDKGGKVIKAPVRTPTLSEKNASVNKIISADAMAWKPVEIPDNLGDYDGFFGLEELEGVDVRMVNGKAEFIAKDDEKESGILDKLFGKDKKRKREKKGSKGEEVKGEEVKGEEIKGDGDQGSKVDGEEVKVGEVEENVEEKVGEESEESEFTGFDEEELIQGTFGNITLPPLDESEIDLPKWEPLGLSAYTMQGLQTNGFSEPTAIQKETIPVAMQGKDVVGKATTGSGKTLAYGVPILERHYKKLREARPKKETVRGQNSEISEVSQISESPKKEISQKEISQIPQGSNLDSVLSSERQWAEVTGIIFAPTRELAHQVVDHLKSITRTSPLSQNGIVSITGGLSIQRQERLLSYKPGVVVATPGRFLELMERSQDLCKRMASTDMVVLDEADRLLQDGHFEEFAKILELLEKFRDKRVFGRKWQTLVFSATFSREFFGKLDRNKTGKAQKSGVSTGLIGNDEILELLTKKLRFKDARPFLCDANPKEIVSGQVTEALVECGSTERDLYIYYFVLNYPGSTLVFANSVESVRRLVPLLENLGMPAFGIHSAMIQKQRLRALERFKASCAKNPSSVLVATDVAARGLDIPNIDHIAHYHLPRSADMYVHRSGRTARAGREGVSVMFCSPQEASGPLRKLRKMVAQGSKSTGNLAHSGVKMLPIDYDIVAQIRERVRMASLLADSSIASTATRKEDNWVKQAAEDLGLDSLSDVEAFEDDVIKKQRKRKETKTLSVEEQKSIRARLRESLAKPLRKNHRRSYLTSGLDNLAHQLATGKTSKTILGMTHVSALDELKGKKGVSKRVNGKEGVSKQTKGKKRN